MPRSIYLSGKRKLVRVVRRVGRRLLGSAAGRCCPTAWDGEAALVLWRGRPPAWPRVRDALGR